MSVTKEAERPTTRRANTAEGEETAQAKYERERAERARSREEAASKERVRRAGLTPTQLAEDDAKRAGETAKENERVSKLTDAERVAEADKRDPLPPWQLRLPSGKVIDVLEQGPISLVATDGRALDGEDRAAALAFYLDYARS